MIIFPRHGRTRGTKGINAGASDPARPRLNALLFLNCCMDH